MLLSILAVLGQITLVSLIGLWLLGRIWPEAQRVLKWLREGLAGTEIWLAFAIALTATAGSLFFSEYSNFIPCHLCWLQRYAMYPLTILLPLAAVIKKRALTAGLLIIPLAGLGISVYHRYIELNPAAGSQQCKAGGGCATNWLQNLAPLEYLTIPTLALTAFGLIIALMLMAIFPVQTSQETEKA